MSFASFNPEKNPYAEFIPEELPPTSFKAFEAAVLHTHIWELEQKLQTHSVGSECSTKPPEVILQEKIASIIIEAADFKTALIEDSLEYNPIFQPPPNYIVHENYIIPKDQYPDIGFVGLLLGPRGETMKQFSRTHSVTVSLRGEGSTQEGQIQRDHELMKGPLRAFVCGKTKSLVKAAVAALDELCQSFANPDDETKQQQLQILEDMKGTGGSSRTFKSAASRFSGIAESSKKQGFGYGFEENSDMDDEIPPWRQSKDERMSKRHDSMPFRSSSASHHDQQDETSEMDGEIPPWRH
ncbi:putative multi-domain containing protein [Aduncisulcus paluster]|uniref:Branchpoint-bridging protein n=1 Tax=Aduncisulcus paluster TaxID=2918883 RepID=A0ABQ5KJZ8_9EUKA|nr:putative multi-domain containing protein [Aduncisulcus paluster]